jgi:hypothetical protein
MSKNIKRKGWIEFHDGHKIDIFEVYRLGNGTAMKFYTPVGIFYYRDEPYAPPYDMYGLCRVKVIHNTLWHVDFNGITDFSGEPQVAVQSVEFYQIVLFDKQVKELYI